MARHALYIILKSDATIIKHFFPQQKKFSPLFNLLKSSAKLKLGIYYFRLYQSSHAVYLSTCKKLFHVGLYWLSPNTISNVRLFGKDSYESVLKNTYSFFRSFADFNYTASSAINAGFYRPHRPIRPFLFDALISHEFTISSA